MPSVVLIAVPVGIFVALILVVIMYSFKERERNKEVQQPTQRCRPPPQPVGQSTTIVYTIPTIRQLEVLFPNLTDITVGQSNEHLPPAYADVSEPPPSYDELQIDVRILEAARICQEKRIRQNSIT